MLRYIVRRLLWVVLVVLVVTMAAFVIFFVFPSTDPAVVFAGKQPSPAVVAEVRKQLGLDHSLPVQYLLFVKHLFLGDQYGWPGLGISYNTRNPVRDVIFQRALVTVQLALGALIIWFVMGVLIGVISATRRRRPVDRLAMGFALLGISTPVFFLGLVALYIFWQKLGIVPGTGYVPFSADPAAWFSHMILPWIVLSLLFAAVYARLVRSNMIDTLHEDYIRTARAAGINERRVVLRYALRASIAPVITLAGIDFATLIGGAVVTETVFNLPGLGNYVLNAVQQSDIPVALAVTVIGALSVTIINLVVDILYAVIDPRVRYE